jgi:uncharacterized protein (TIRG00374 family)
LGQLGLGLSSMVSTGDKYDVSGNDLLMWWQRDPGTTDAALYRESFGSPRKFGQLARQLARTKPVHVLVPQLTGARQTLGLLAHVNTLYVVAGVLLEAASLFVYSMLTRTVLPAPNRPPITTLVRIDLTTLGMNHVIPGGGATANALRYRLLTVSGVSGADAVFGTVVQGVGSAIVLNAMLWLELIAAIPRYGLTHFFGVSAALGAALFAAAAAVALGLTRAENWTIQRVRPIATHLPRVSADGAERQVRQLAHHLTTFGSDRGLMVRAIVRAAMNWLLDAAPLWVFVAAFGYHANVIGLLFANVLAVLPFTPGGLGIVEGVLVPALIAVGAPHGIAILGVLGWRLVNFWLPIPLSGLAYLSLRTGPLREHTLPTRRPWHDDHASRSSG